MRKIYLLHYINVSEVSEAIRQGDLERNHAT